MKYAKQVLAGIFIGIGGTVYLNTMPNIWAPFLFSIGLLSVVLTGTPLYTGRIGYFPLGDSSQWLTAARDYLIMLVCNLVGAGLAGLAARVVCGTDASALAAAKAAQAPGKAFLLAVGCGMMMYIAVEGYKRTKNLFMLMLPVAVFILCGFDHCIADMFYFSYAGALPHWYYFPAVIAGNSVGAAALHQITKER